MAIKADKRTLSEAELNSPDLDDDGEVDVEYYPLPSGDTIEDPYLAEVWQAAVDEIGSQAGEEDVGKSAVQIKSNGPINRLR